MEIEKDKINAVIRNKLEHWVNNVPDYYELKEAYTIAANIRKDIIAIKRQIERAEELVAIEENAPRSNDARKRRLQATMQLKDQLAEKEQELEIVEARVKFGEINVRMFNPAMYRKKMLDNDGI